MIRKIIALILIAFLFLVAPVFAGVQFIYPKFQAYDSNGDPLSGGLLYTYAANSATAKATYSDRGLTAANTNPVVLDSRGEAVVYGSGQYKFTLRDSAGSLIWTFDYLDGIGGYLGGNFFFPDAGQADQGVAVGSVTVKDFVDAIGATKTATIVFSRGSTGDTTDYTFLTSETITSNINCQFEQGARTAPALGITVTFYSPANIIAQPNQQIFSGTGIVSFSAPGVAHPGWFPDVDYGARINAAINAVEANKGSVVISQPGSFATTIQLKTGASVFFNNHSLTYTGTGTAIKNYAGTYSGRFYDLHLLVAEDWTNVNLIGLYLTNAYKCSGEGIAIEGFTTGFKLESVLLANGSAYNNFFLRNFSTNKISIHIVQSVTGWTNENKFYNGSLSPGSAAPAGSIGIKIESTSTSASDHNVFISPSLESWETAISCINAQSSMFFSPRLEANTTDIIYDANSVRNFVIGPVGAKITDNSALLTGSNYEMTGMINAGAHEFQEKITAGVAVTSGYGYITLQVETGTSDDLDTITGGRKGDILVLKETSPTHAITIKHATGNIRLSSLNDLILYDQVLVLFYDGTNWMEIGKWSAGRSGVQLLSRTVVSLAADADTVIYTVPTGRSCFLTYAVLTAGADAGATSTMSIGRAGTETDFIPANTLSNLDAAGDGVILMPIPSLTPAKIKYYGEGVVIEARVGSNSGGVTNYLYLYGFLY